MKYVRTKDYVYEPITDINSKSYNFKAKTCDSYVLVPKSTIVKASDTIEGLCDGFWWENKKYDEPIFIPNYPLALERFNAWKQYDEAFDVDSLANITIYGSIYIKGQGWQHIAKFNKKGELELL